MPEAGRRRWVAWMKAGILAGLAMVPFAAVFRALDLRVNEYGRKTLVLFVGDVAPPLRDVLMFAQHLAISAGVALPLALALSTLGRERDGLALGAAYGIAFYVAVNSLALPLAFGDPTPWSLGLPTVLPSFTIHLVYGGVLGWMLARDAARAG